MEFDATHPLRGVKAGGVKASKQCEAVYCTRDVLSRGISGLKKTLTCLSVCRRHGHLCFFAQSPRVFVSLPVNLLTGSLFSCVDCACVQILAMHFMSRGVDSFCSPVKRPDGEPRGPSSHRRTWQRPRPAMARAEKAMRTESSKRRSYL